MTAEDVLPLTDKVPYQLVSLHTCQECVTSGGFLSLRWAGGALDLPKPYWFMIRCVSGSEPERRMSSTNAQLATSSSYATFSTPKPTQCTTVPSTAELYRTLRLMPDGRYDRRDFSKDLVVLVFFF